MSVERTLSIIKPDAVADGHTGAILNEFIKANFEILGTKMLRLSRQQAEAFYAVHQERPFYQDLVDFMISGPVVVTALRGDNAIARHRDLMGATNPADAEDGTLRKLFGKSIDANAVHGSDGPDTAMQEIPFFFTECELLQNEPGA